MHFMLLARDKPGREELRQANRSAHLAYFEETGNAVVAAGPYLSDDGANMIGSLIVLDVADLDAAKAWAENDPYNKAGLFDVVEIRPWRWVVGAPSKE